MRLSPSKRRLLDLLKRGVATTTAELSQNVVLTKVAVRQHLLALERMGLVRAVSAAPSGRGRPAARWSLTAEARTLFPESHPELAVGLIEATRRALGDRGLRRVIEERARNQAERYRVLLPPPGAPLKERLQALARERTGEGYMAEVSPDPPDGYLLSEHHCPISDAARACLGLCRAELEVFQSALGADVEVERVSHLLSGDVRCVYRVRPR